MVARKLVVAVRGSVPVGMVGVLVVRVVVEVFEVGMVLGVMVGKVGNLVGMVGMAQRVFRICSLHLVAEDIRFDRGGLQRMMLRCSSRLLLISAIK